MNLHHIKILCALCAFLYTASAREVLAHPHVFITATFSFLFEGDLIKGVRSYWVFDPVFSMELVRGFDKNGDGAFDGTESAEIASVILSNLQAFHYLTFVQVSGRVLPPQKPEQFLATLKNGRVAFSLYTPLPQAVNAKKSDISVYSYDPSYDIEVTMSEQKPVVFEKLPESANCATKKFEETDPAYWAGQITYQRIRLSC